MRMLTFISLFALLAGAPSNSLGQGVPPAKVSKAPRNVWTRDDPGAFCKNDRRPEINAYCADLAQLQTRVNEEKTLKTPDLSVKNSNFTDSLNKLNITKQRALDDFITATAVRFAANQVISSALRGAGQQRPDQQFSPDNNASGTTSLVSKAGSAELLSFALNSGVVTQSVNGTTATVSTNADQFFRLITQSNPDCIVTTDQCRSRGWFEDKILTPTNVSAGLSLAQQSGSTTPTSGQASGTTSAQVSQASIPTGAGKLSSLTVRYQVRNGFDPRSDKFKAAWQAQVTTLLKAKVTAIGNDTDAVKTALYAHKSFSGTDSDKDGSFAQVQFKLLQAAVKDSNGLELVKAFETYWNDEVTSDITNDPTLAAAVSKVVQDRAVYRQAWFNALDQAAGNLFTLDYNYNRPVNQPITHDFKIIYAYDFGTAGMLTFNGAVSIYGAIPAGAKYGSLHYGQVSTQYDQTLWGKGKAIQTQLSLAGYWQYQPHPSILDIPAGTVAPGTNIPLPNGTQEFVGTAGSLWVTQAKLTIKGTGGLNIPIGVSWSNKTDLLQGSKVGGQVGISYNFSSLTGLFGGSGGSQ